MGVINYQEGKIGDALEHFLRAEAADPRLPTLHQRLGNAYLRLRRWKDAQRAFNRALEIDEDCPRSRLGLAIVALRERRPRDAAAEALAAVGIRHFLPQGHFILGVALVRIGERERARLALETAVSMAPGLLVARRYLAALYRREGNLDKFAEHRTRAVEIRLRRRARRQ
jgi:tetratricopeptide (TPR) repeat protein